MDGGGFFGPFCPRGQGGGYVECPRLSTWGGEGVKFGSKLVHVVVECPLRIIISDNNHETDSIVFQNRLFKRNGKSKFVTLVHRCSADHKNSNVIWLMHWTTFIGHDGQKIRFASNCTNFNIAWCIVNYTCLMAGKLHCKYIHCKNYSFSLCPVSRCTFAVFFYIEELPVVNHCIFYKIQQKSVKMTSE